MLPIFVEVVLILLAAGSIIGWLWSIHRRQIEDARRRGREESAARYQAMIEDQTDLICRFDGDGNRIFVNEAYSRFHDRTREELIGTPIGSFLAESEARELRQDIANLTPESPRRECERFTVRHNGEGHWHHWKTTGIFDSEGRMVELQGVGRDITERKLTELALRESEERFRALAANSPTAIFLKDRDGKYLLINEVFETWYGTGEKIVGKTVYELLPFERADVFNRQDQEVFATGATLEWEMEQRLANGEEQVTLVTKFPVRGPDGDIVAIGGINTDITERKRGEEALKESEKRLRLFTDAMPALFSYVDKDLRYRFCNLYHEKHFRKKREEIIGRTVEETLGPVAYRQVKPVLDRALGGENVFFEHWITYREAGRTFMRGSLIPDRSDSGEVEGCFVMIQDMTAKKRAEDSLAKAKDQAEKTSASKSRYLATASHDLRQPMQALAMFVEVLAGRQHDQGSREIIDKIQASSKALESLLNSLLDISKLEADLVVPAVRRFTAGELTSRLAEEIEPRAQGRGLKLAHVPSSLQVMSDPGLLDRVLRNLLINAVDNTEKGKILFGCRRFGKEVRFEVWDTGCGIPEDQKALIFDEFYQGDARDGTRANGLGLGLAIVDRLIELLGHRVTVDSIPGKGSRFTVHVPVADADAVPDTPEQAHIADDASGGLVVGIEDDPTVREALSLLLKSWGFDAVMAATQNEAMLRLSAENRSPDLVIADFQLSRGNKGSNAIEAIRRRWGRSIPGLLLTGDTNPKNLEEATASGFKVVHKPIHPEKLKAVVTEHMESAQPNPRRRADRRKSGSRVRP